MRVVFTKTSHQRHDVTCVREDGTRAVASNLESRSLLRHDLMHYVIEKQAGLMDTFYGPIARGRTFTDLRTEDGVQMSSDTEGGITEKVVAMMQSTHQDSFNPDVCLAMMCSGFENAGSQLPNYVSVAFISKASSEFRFLLKQWNGLQTGKTLELEFP
jgi:hypothetical protein